MDESTAAATAPLAPSAAEAPERPKDTLLTWAREGLRTAFLLKPRVTGSPKPVHLIVLLALGALVHLGLQRLEIPGAANFSVEGWLTPWWTEAVWILLLWSLLWGVPADATGNRPQGVATWMALGMMGSIPLVVLGGGLDALRAHGALPAWLDGPAMAWVIFVVVWGWMILVPVVLGRRFGMNAPRLVALALGLVAIQWIAMSYFYARPWYPDRSDEEDTAPRFSISQESFEQQQAVWQQAVGSLAPERPGVRDVYALVFAPYANEDVFLRESTMVGDVLAQRFDAQGRVLQLVNHRSTGDRLPWATPLNLKRGIEALAQRMDRENDVLVLYLTSHGARNFKLAASHWPLQVEPVHPEELRRMLDEAGIRHRVVAISACYSGGWVGPLASDTTLVMTAADADHTSYGCGSRSELTYFGRALFDEQLRTTHSFEQAFAAAVPLIKQREEQAGKADGFSNPQISVGGKVRPVLDEVAQRLDGAPRP